MELTKNPKGKEEKKTTSFSSRFKKLNLPLHGVRLPKFHIEERYIKQFGLKADINTYDFLREICLKRFSELRLNKSPDKKVYIDNKWYKYLFSLKEIKKLSHKKIFLKVGFVQR